MKLSLLEMTQQILSSMGSDEVNSIGDTTESLQVANIIKTSYMNMLGRYDLPEHNQLITLNPSGSNTQPVLMLRPDDVTRIEWIKYFNSNPLEGSTFQVDQFGAYSHDLNVDIVNSGNGWTTTSTTANTIATGTQVFTVGSGLLILTGQSVFCSSGINQMSGTVISYSGTTLTLNITLTIGSGTYSSWTIAQESGVAVGPGYQDIKILTNQDFLHMVNQFNPSQTDVGSFTLSVTSNASGEASNFTFYYKNDTQPRYCTILQNYYIIFDAYDSTQDTTLQASKTMCLAWVVPVFTMTDTFVPELDDQQVPLLLNEAKSLAFYELKQQSHQKAEEEVSRQLVSLQKWKSLANHPTWFDELPNFGRWGRGYGR